MGIGKLFLMRYGHPNPAFINLRNVFSIMSDYRLDVNPAFIKLLLLNLVPIGRRLPVSLRKLAAQSNLRDRLNRYLLLRCSSVTAGLTNLRILPSIIQIGAISLRQCGVGVYQERYSTRNQVKEYIKAVLKLFISNNVIANMLSSLKNTTCVYGGCL
jgi:hypothetical protein